MAIQASMSPPETIEELHLYLYDHPGQGGRLAENYLEEVLELRRRLRLEELRGLEVRANDLRRQMNLYGALVAGAAQGLQVQVPGVMAAAASEADWRELLAQAATAYPQVLARSVKVADEIGVDLSIEHGLGWVRYVIAE